MIANMLRRALKDVASLLFPAGHPDQLDTPAGPVRVGDVLRWGRVMRLRVVGLDTGEGVPGLLVLLDAGGRTRRLRVACSEAGMKGITKED